MNCTRNRLALTCAWSSQRCSSPLAARAARPATGHHRRGQGPRKWDGFVNRFIEDSLKANPFQGVDAGRHEFDGKAPDWSTQGIADEITRLKIRSRGSRGLPGRCAHSGATLRAGLPRRRRHRPEPVLAGHRALSVQEPGFLHRPARPRCVPQPRVRALDKRMAGASSATRAASRSSPRILRANLQTPAGEEPYRTRDRGLGGYAEFYKSDVPKVFASVQDADLAEALAEGNRRRGDGDERPQDVARIGAQERDERFRARRSAVLADAEADRKTSTLH